VTVLVLFSGFFHELGHATATRYSGGSASIWPGRPSTPTSPTPTGSTVGAG
jgi:hypothetical protein